MPSITFLPSGVTYKFHGRIRLFDAAKNAGLPIASSCGGEFVCGKCAMKIIQGGESLSPLGDVEKKLLAREKHSLENRISCHTYVTGDCIVTTGYW